MRVPRYRRAQGNMAGSTSLADAGGEPAKSGYAMYLPFASVAAAFKCTPIPSTFAAKIGLSPS